jgi:hypothetical protein
MYDFKVLLNAPTWMHKMSAILSQDDLLYYFYFRLIKIFSEFDWRIVKFVLQ